MRWWFAVVVGMLLGCSGLLEQVLELDGTEIQQYAPIPDDYPLPPPPNGRQDTSTLFTSDTSVIHLVQYILDEGTPPAEILDFYEQALKDAGHTPERKEWEVLVRTEDGQRISADVNSINPTLLGLSWRKPVVPNVGDEVGE